MSTTLHDAFRAALSRATLDSVAAGLHVRVRIESGDMSVDIVIADGQASFSDSVSDPDIAIRATKQTWSLILSPSPPPRFNSFTALQIKNDDVEVKGSTLTIAQARPALEELFESLRAPTAVPSAVRRDIGLIRGRYVSAMIDGQAVQMYCEEAGRGPLVLLLHTAGADSRQFQSLLSDIELAERWRMIAFDMPSHGRSFPADLLSKTPYALTERLYSQTVAAFIENVIREKVILVGCSMGAAISLVLAAERPELVNAVIALEPPLKSPGRRNPYLAHAMVANGPHNSAYIRGLMSPDSPVAERRRAEWIYAQGGPGVYAGDLKFYSDEFDGHVIGPQIDATKVAVHLMTGEYDYSAPPEDGEQLCRLIKGSSFERMPGLGHFPMTENPDVFRTYFASALGRVASKT